MGLSFDSCAHSVAGELVCLGDGTVSGGMGWRYFRTVTTQCFCSQGLCQATYRAAALVLAIHVVLGRSPAVFQVHNLLLNRELVPALVTLEVPWLNLYYLVGASRVL